ncbi:MAG: hypothetical protein RIB58_09925 [Phycisphaerales bacterium]
MATRHIFRFRSPMHAVAVRDYFVQNGVPAQVVGGNSDAAGVWGRDAGPYEVVLASKADVHLAVLLLEQFGNEPAEYEAELEELAVPDLSVLDEALAPDCAACGARLPLDASVPVCPACGEPVDIAERIVDRHGPEVLAACYDAMPSSDELMELGGSPGTCPTCGRRLQPGSACPTCPRFA